MADSSSGQEGSSSFDLGKLRTELECCICLSLFEDPRQLQCGHICCAACLQSLIDMANEPGVVGILFGGKSQHKTITCPQCHQENGVSEDEKFQKASIVKKTVEDPIKLAKAEELRLKGNESYGRNIFEEAIKFYTLSIRECASSTCLSNRAQANIRLGRFSLAYVDANEALRLDPNNEKAKARRDKALECMGKCGKNQLWPNDVRISIIHLMNEDFVGESMAMHQNVVCVEAVGEGMRCTPVPLRQLDLYLNDEHVQGPVPQVIFKFVKFDDQMVQVFRRIKPERFQKADIGGKRHFGNDFSNCDFSKLSESSFRFLFDSHLFGSTNTISISEWTGMPAGYNYNSLFKLKMFKDAVEVRFDFGDKIGPDSADFNLHLDTDVLIGFLHSPGFKSLHLIDGQLHEGFDAFLDRLLERFQGDSESRFYEVSILVLNATDKAKRRLELNRARFLQNARNNELRLDWSNKPVDRLAPIPDTCNTDNLFAFRARCVRSREDINAIHHYHSDYNNGAKGAASYMNIIRS